ncbi:hypothetical protein AC1031_018944 [Aphanomyces cochlioides]|nr:hypothetical protein AC1031_018944 [Aphanomyces cochlioides]
MLVLDIHLAFCSSRQNDMDFAYDSDVTDAVVALWLEIQRKQAHAASVSKKGGSRTGKKPNIERRRVMYARLLDDDLSPLLDQWTQQRKPTPKRRFHMLSNWTFQRSVLSTVPRESRTPRDEQCLQVKACWL